MVAHPLWGWTLAETETFDIWSLLNDDMVIAGFLAQPIVEDKDETNPSNLATDHPNNGEAWLIDGTGAGDWSGRDNQVALWNNGFIYFIPPDGMTIYVRDEKAAYRWDQSQSQWVCLYAEVSIADDGFVTFRPPGWDGTDSFGSVVVSFDSANGYGAAHFEAATPSMAKTDADFNTSVDVTTGALNGTTGVDTTLTLSIHTDNLVYVENRLGAAAQVRISFV